MDSERLKEIRRIAHHEAEPLVKTNEVRVALGKMLQELLAHVDALEKIGRENLGYVLDAALRREIPFHLYALLSSDGRRKIRESMDEWKIVGAPATPLTPCVGQPMGDNELRRGAGQPMEERK